MKPEPEEESFNSHGILPASSPGRTRFYKCDALSDQTDILDYECTATDVASVWNSILAYWFPPDEGYQLRLEHRLEWVEVYVIRVAVRPHEQDITFNPVFLVRCYGARADVPHMGTWEQTMVQVPISVTEVCRSISANGRPAFGAIACADIVRLCEFHLLDGTMRACDTWPGVYFLSLFKEDIQEYLDYVKAEFAKEWGHPYSSYWDSDEGPKRPAGAWDRDNKPTRTLNTSVATDDGNASMVTSSAGSSDLDTDSDCDIKMENDADSHLKYTSVSTDGTIRMEDEEEDVKLRTESEDGKDEDQRESGDDGEEDLRNSSRGSSNFRMDSSDNGGATIILTDVQVEIVVRTGSTRFD
ncbi:hypothetical protein N7462_000140 [Penicillium macrosclerotiorum]|uniref:uncharacterized protein n=1 Tax=Penicillium macrosclerotiorum TaxID=303699 RepID=UPI0025475E10|nr:uncharacterized protein N7462_000140 [Penicillium macrosclerotiorum]KAJ5698135.1 hypothetical protein N7462_000140 [Penicillium macrosclerotiorum]